jgi:molybdenum cofactor cytidylyltransferase
LNQTTGSTAGIILAAGSSSRLGTPKQLLLWQGQPLVKIVSQKLLATGIQPIIVVVGAESNAVKKALEDLDITTVENLYWKEGISTSIRAGIAALPDNIQAAIFATSDQPFVPESLIRKLIDEYRQTGAEIICPECKGELRNPVLFDKSLFAELTQLEGDTGGKALFDHHRITRVEWQNEEDFRDIDTQEEMQEMYGKSC